MLPMALLTLLAIYLVYLRRVPRTVGETGRSKKECVRLLLRSLWSLLLAIAVIIVFFAADVGSCSRRRGCQRAGRKILRAGGA